MTNDESDARDPIPLRPRSSPTRTNSTATSGDLVWFPTANRTNPPLPADEDEPSTSLAPITVFLARTPIDGNVQNTINKIADGVGYALSNPSWSSGVDPVQMARILCRIFAYRAGRHGYYDELKPDENPEVHRVKARVLGWARSFADNFNMDQLIAAAYKVRDVSVHEDEWGVINAHEPPPSVLAKSLASFLIVVEKGQGAIAPRNPGAYYGFLSSTLEDVSAGNYTTAAKAVRRSLENLARLAISPDPAPER